RQAVPIVLALTTVGWLLAVEGREGIGRDEAQYFRAGEHYWSWFESGWQNLRAGHPFRSFSRAGIDGYWGDNPEHPPVMKTLYGIALGVKLNAWLMPFFLAAHYLWIRRGDLRRRRLPPFPLAFAAMATIGPLVFFASWPFLWPDPVNRVRGYMRRHLDHEHYNF